MAKVLMIVLTVTVILSTVAVSVSAAEAPKFIALDNTLVEIQNPQAKMTMPGSITKIGSNVVTENEEVVKELVIGTNIKEIESGAFSNCSNLKTVTIHQDKGDIKIASGAFNSGVKILYLDDIKPTTTKPTTTKPSTTKAEPTTKEETTTAVEEETTEEVATVAEDGEMVVLEDETPFADAKSQLSDKNIWDALIDQTTGAAANPTSINNPVVNTASYAAVVVVAMSAVVLGYLKFKK